MTQSKSKKTNSSVKQRVEKENEIVKDNKSGGSGEQLEQIRALLFGEQLYKLEQNIQLQQDNLSERLDNLEALINKNTGDLDKKVSDLQQGLLENLEANRLEHVSQEAILEESITRLDKRLDDFQQATEQDFSETLNSLNNTAKDINQSLQKEVQELTQKLEKASMELGANKTDRKTLAALLESMASNLTENQA